MKQFKAIAAVLGMALCVSGCNQTKTGNNAEANSVNAAAPENAAPAANAAANEGANAAAENMSAPANATNNGDRTDTGPRGNPNG